MRVCSRTFNTHLTSSLSSFRGTSAVNKQFEDSLGEFGGIAPSIPIFKSIRDIEGLRAGGQR